MEDQTSRYCVFVGGNLVAWRSIKQSVFSRSSVKQNLDLWHQEFINLCAKNVNEELGASQ